MLADASRFNKVTQNHCTGPLRVQTYCFHFHFGTWSPKNRSNSQQINQSESRKEQRGEKRHWCWTEACSNYPLMVKKKARGESRRVMSARSRGRHVHNIFILIAAGGEVGAESWQTGSRCEARADKRQLQSIMVRWCEYLWWENKTVLKIKKRK